MSANPEAEIVDLHVFLEGWLSGRLEKSEAVFARFAEALDPAFRIVSPRGIVTARKPLLAELWAGHGGAGADFRIDIRDVRRIETSGGPPLLTYQEWQFTGPETDVRISTVIFRPDPAGLNGVRWLHLHETWMPGE